MNKNRTNCGGMSKKMHLAAIGIAAVVLLGLVFIGGSFALLRADLDGAEQRVTAGTMRLDVSLTMDDGFLYAPGMDLISDAGLEIEIGYFFSRPSDLRVRLYYKTEECDDYNIVLGDGSGKVLFEPSDNFDYYGDGNLDYIGVLAVGTRGTIGSVFDSLVMRGGHFVLESGEVSFSLRVYIKQAGIDWTQTGFAEFSV